MGRVFNFSAGPAMLPEEVLKTAAAEMLDYNGSGMSVMEMSHRSATFKGIIAPAKQSLVFEYVDAPGRIGAIGTLLGNEGVNITTMQIGTKPSEKTALVYMNVEGNVNDQLLEKLSSTLDFKNVWSFSL